MEVNNKFKLIKKLYSNKKDYNYFFNPFYPSRKVDINFLKSKWIDLYNRDINHLTHFYIHTPFCLEKCNFCQYHSGFDIKDNTTIDNYLDYLEKYLLKFSDIFKGKKFGGLYFGGGTPSIYSEVQLERLLKLIFDNINFSGEYLMEFELHPMTTTFKKLKILKKYGIERITFGIQSFNKQTIKKEGRTYCSPERFKKLINYAKKLGFESINADLILGLNSESKEEILKGLEKMFDCEPYSITLYTLQKNKEKSNLYDGEDVFYNEVKKIHDYLIDNLINDSNYDFSDYNLNTGIQLKLKSIKDINKDSYDTHAKNIESVFSIGFGAYSQIFGLGKYYIPDDIYELDNFILNFEALSIEDEKNIFLARFVQSGLTDLRFLKEKFDFDLLKDYKIEIEFLLKNNKIKLDNDMIKFTSKNIKETYIFGLLLFDLKFVLHHALYIDKNFKK